MIQGDTLASISAHYKTSADTLRAANSLTAVKDNDVLASMLLRVPGQAAPAAKTMPVAPAETRSALPEETISDEMPTGSMVNPAPDSVYKSPTAPTSGHLRLDVRVLGSPETIPSQSLAEVVEVAERDAHIRRLPRASAETLYSRPVGTELAVVRQQNDWSAVVMSDKSIGWIPTHCLHRTGGRVDIGFI